MRERERQTDKQTDREGDGQRVDRFYPFVFQVLEEIGVLQNIRRFAGASGGAVICSLLAVGYDVRGLYEFFAVDLTKMSSGGLSFNLSSTLRVH